MLRITSRGNPRLKEVARLLASARERRKAGKCVLEGEHLIGAYAERFGPPELLVVAEHCVGREAVSALAVHYAERTLVVARPLFAELATLPAGVGILALIAAPARPPAPAADFCLLLEDVQDPGNVGSMLRSAAAAGVAQVHLSRHCAFVWSPKVLRAAQGAHFHLELYEDVDLATWGAGFVASGGRLAATVARGGTPVFDAPLGGRVAVAIGNEGAGLSAGLLALASCRVTIPMPGGTESLNAAAAAAVCLFECVRQRR